MQKLPRGIAPDLLVSQVENTMPYLFRSDVENTPLAAFPPGQVLRDYKKSIDQGETKPLTHFEYYRLCLSAHYSSCGTPVPTDVDNQIRLKLWPKELPLEIALEMATLILASRKYDFRLVSTRYAYGAKNTPWENETVNGHLGEWFTVACGAYCALKNYKSTESEAKRTELYAAIEDEVHRHSEIFGSLWRADDGLGALKASASLAHNFGDLDRVMDMWELGPEDPLRQKFYKLGASPYDANRNLRYLGRLWVAGELYKSTMSDGSSMALENHRHYALRKPKCLRKKPEFLVPNAPFFDGWGEALVKGLALNDGSASEETLEVFETLKEAWQKQRQTFAYGRALRAFLAAYPELHLEPNERARIQETQAEFESRWAREALAHMEDIPSRAD